MKKLFALLLISISIFSCNQPYQSQPQYQIITGPNGQQMVQYQDNGQTLLMDYLIWNQLYNQGGYNSIRNYNTTHTVIHYNPSQYSNWKRSSYSPPSALRSNNTSTGTKFKTNNTSGFRSNTSSTFSSKPSSNGFRSSSSTGFRSSKSSGFRSSGKH
jgi:hypothetical protein